MRSVVYYEKTAGAIDVRNMPVPKIGPQEVLVKVEYCGVCGSELHVYHGELDELARPPVILGHEWSGEVVEVGKDVKGFQAGDRVVSETAAETCGVCVLCRSDAYNLCPERRAFGFAVDGAFTNYVRGNPNGLHHIPDGVSYEAATLTEPTCVAYNAVVEKSHVRPGDTVAVIGPGPIGLLCLQIAKLAGAGITVVTGTARDTQRLELAHRLGADITVNINDQDPANVVRGLGDGYGAHLVVDAAGTPAAMKQSLALVRPNGQVTKLGWALQPVNFSMDEIVAKAITYQGSFSHTWKTWERVLEMLRLGQMETEPLISEIWPITRWKESFDRIASLEACKILLHPVD